MKCSLLYSFTQHAPVTQRVKDNSQSMRYSVRLFLHTVGTPGLKEQVLEMSEESFSNFMEAEDAHGKCVFYLLVFICKINQLFKHFHEISDQADQLLNKWS
jgi:hypothetical protein